MPPDISTQETIDDKIRKAKDFKQRQIDERFRIRTEVDEQFFGGPTEEGETDADIRARINLSHQAEEEALDAARASGTLQDQSGVTSLQIEGEEQIRPGAIASVDQVGDRLSQPFPIKSDEEIAFAIASVRPAIIRADPDKLNVNRERLIAFERKQSEDRGFTAAVKGTIKDDVVGLTGRRRRRGEAQNSLPASRIGDTAEKINAILADPANAVALDEDEFQAIEPQLSASSAGRQYLEMRDEAESQFNSDFTEVLPNIQSSDDVDDFLKKYKSNPVISGYASEVVAREVNKPLYQRRFRASAVLEAKQSALDKKEVLASKMLGLEKSINEPKFLTFLSEKNSDMTEEEFSKVKEQWLDGSNIRYTEDYERWKAVFGVTVEQKGENAGRMKVAKPSEAELKKAEEDHAISTINAGNYDIESPDVQKIMIKTGSVNEDELDILNNKDTIQETAELPTGIILATIDETQSVQSMATKSIDRVTEGKDIESAIKSVIDELDQNEEGDKIVYREILDQVFLQIDEKVVNARAVVVEDQDKAHKAVRDFVSDFNDTFDIAEASRDSSFVEGVEKAGGLANYIVGNEFKPGILGTLTKEDREYVHEGIAFAISGNKEAARKYGPINDLYNSMRLTLDGSNKARAFEFEAQQKNDNIAKNDALISMNDVSRKNVILDEMKVIDYSGNDIVIANKDTEDFIEKINGLPEDDPLRLKFDSTQSEYKDGKVWGGKKTPKLSDFGYQRSSVPNVLSQTDVDPTNKAGLIDLYRRTTQSSVISALDGTDRDFQNESIVADPNAIQSRLGRSLTDDELSEINTGNQTRTDELNNALNTYAQSSVITVGEDGSKDINTLKDLRKIENAVTGAKIGESYVRAIEDGLSSNEPVIQELLQSGDGSLRRIGVKLAVAQYIASNSDTIKNSDTTARVNIDQIFNKQPIDLKIDEVSKGQIEDGGIAKDQLIEDLRVAKGQVSEESRIAMENLEGLVESKGLLTVNTKKIDDAILKLGQDPEWISVPSDIKKDAKLNATTKLDAELTGKRTVDLRRSKIVSDRASRRMLIPFVDRYGQVTGRKILDRMSTEDPAKFIELFNDSLDKEWQKEYVEEAKKITDFKKLNDKQKITKQDFDKVYTDALREI